MFFFLRKGKGAGKAKGGGKVKALAKPKPAVTGRSTSSKKPKTGQAAASKEANDAERLAKESLSDLKTCQLSMQDWVQRKDKKPKEFKWTESFIEDFNEAHTKLKENMQQISEFYAEFDAASSKPQAINALKRKYQASVAVYVVVVGYLVAHGAGELPRPMGGSLSE